MSLIEDVGRLKELEADNENLVAMNRTLMKNDRILRDNNRKYRKRSQRAELQNKELREKQLFDDLETGQETAKARFSLGWRGLRASFDPSRITCPFS
jgi:hypothetical protein